MNNKYAVGKYITKVFDEYGTNILTLDTAKTCTEAEQQGEDAGGDSYVVMRVIINSKKVGAR